MAEDANSSNLSSVGHKPLTKYTAVVPSQTFKGVHRRKSGAWGCRICAYRRHIWLGTFKSKEDATMAYQSAALKLQDSKAARNLPASEAIADELKFQSVYSTVTVLNMIKDGTYPFCFAYYLKTRSHSPSSNEGMISEKMFQKELTPSDVGRLSVLVIRKKSATKFFPPIAVETEDNSPPKGVPLYFYDRSMKLWKFKYCYRRCNQTYVLTSGWSSFVKAKALNVNDTIAFLKCESDGGTSTFYMIDVNPGDSSSSGGGSSSGLTNPSQQPLPGPTIVSDNDDVGKRDPGTEYRAIMLFGVDISSTGN